MATCSNPGGIIVTVYISVCVLHTYHTMEVVWPALPVPTGSDPGRIIVDIFPPVTHHR